jgi:hypothetical protein
MRKKKFNKELIKGIKNMNNYPFETLGPTEDPSFDMKMEKYELESQTWPIWLLPEDFRSWYIHEQNVRKNSGRMALPEPPIDVIYKVFRT